MLFYPATTFAGYNKVKCTYNLTNVVTKCTDNFDSNCYVYFSAIIDDEEMNVKYPGIDGIPLIRANGVKNSIVRKLYSDMCWMRDNSSLVLIDNPKPSAQNYVIGIILTIGSIGTLISFFYYLKKSIIVAKDTYTTVHMEGYTSFKTFINEDECEDHSIFRYEQEVRMLFIRRVYGRLFFQLVITFSIIAFFLLHRPSRLFIQENWWLMLVGWIVGIAFLITLMCFKDKSPHNMIILTLFTICFSVSIAFTCVYFGANIVFQAALTTLVVFACLTLFTFQKKIDFSFLAVGIMTVFFSLIMFLIILLIFPYASYFQLVYGFIGAVLFSLFIVYDTQVIMEAYGPGDETIASVTLYLDLMNLFLYILYILGASNNN
jgi:FtsH-binding integral membrane protein